MLYAEVFILGDGRTTPVRALPWILHIQLINLVLVIRYVEVEVQTEVFLVYDYGIERQLNTLVRGLAEVLELVRVTCVGWNDTLHQEVLGGIPVEVQCTAEATIEETVVDTEVTGHCGFPLQVWIIEKFTMLKHRSSVLIEEWSL